MTRRVHTIGDTPVFEDTKLLFASLRNPSVELTVSDFGRAMKVEHIQALEEARMRQVVNNVEEKGQKEDQEQSPE